MSKLVDVETLARRYGVAPCTILAWVRRAWVPALRAGARRSPLRFNVEDVDAALRARNAEAIKVRAGR